MKSRRHSTAAVRSATVDLFAARPASSIVVADRMAGGPVALARGVPPLAQPCVRPAARPLWYAVVFPELAQSQSDAQLRRLCLSALRFTPRVSIEMPQALLLEIRGSVKLFGSLQALHAAIDAEWHRLSLRAQTATAPTTLAALWFARAGKPALLEDPGLLAGALAELPISCTSWSADWLQRLRALGVNRLGELLRLPRAGLARRLGPDAIHELDVALARQAAPRKAFVPRERFRERCDFETEIDSVPYLQKALEPLLERCAQFLRERQAGIQALELKLRHRVIALTRVPLGLASVTSDLCRLTDVMVEKLHRLELPAPVRGMELRSGSLQPLPSDSLDAFAGFRGSGGIRGSEGAPQLVERLRARLGDAAVYGLCPIAEHRPEAAWRRVHELCLAAIERGSDMRVGDVRVGDVRVGEAARPVEARPVEARPVWLMAEPVRLATDLKPLLDDGLTLERGPERIESGWWDGKDVARDYYVARPAAGARWWVFQERLSRCWFLHGIFA